MQLRKLTLAALLAFLPAAASAQSAGPVVAAASKAMGAETLNSITYSGTARNGAFGQSKAIGDPMGPVNVTQITQYTRTINFGTPADSSALVSRATGPTQPPTVPGVPPPMPGVFNQNITAMQANTNWNQGLNIWTTPWGFLKGAAANNATVRQQGGQQVVSFSPPLKSPSGQAYTVTGYINNQNQVTKVETRVDNAVVGDLLVEFEYLELPEHERRADADAHGPAPGGHADVRRDDHDGVGQSREPDRTAHPAAAAGRAGRRSGRTAARSASGPGCGPGGAHR